ncbi:MAG: glycosyl transferase [Alphaproteobacteria bacterium]|nr:glycosyl transferase [Alphaproteobacteria bacterium]
MNILNIKKQGSRHKVYLFGKKVLSYKGKRSKFENIYARRFDNLTMDEKIYIIKHQFKETAEYELNLDKPQTFNEKLQWLKLFNEDPNITIAAGKDTAKEYVKKVIGEEYVVPNIAIYSSVDEIDFDKLPNEFVLKVNWGSGQNIIVRDKKTANIKEIKEKLNHWMQPTSNHYFFSFEFSYKNIIPKIVCEPYIGELKDNLTCYKVFNFGSKPYLIQAVFDDKTSYETINYYDLNWNKLDLRQNFPNNLKTMPAPKNLKKMLELAEKLAEPFPYFVRTDFYEIGDKILFSEFTFFSDNGMAAFHPKNWDQKLGDLIKLPNIV